MTNPRITLKGATLDACNRIIEQTPIENYTELFKLLLMRYEQEFIEATNGYLRQAQPQLDTAQPEVVTTQTTDIPSSTPVNPDGDIPQPQLDIPKPGKSAKNMLMDFEN